MKVKTITALAVFALLAAGCGTARKVVFDSTQVPLPSQFQADSIAAALLSPAPAAAVPYMTAAGPEVLCIAMADSGYVRIGTVTPVPEGWTLSGDATYPCYDNDGLSHASLGECGVQAFGGKDFVVMKTLRTADGGPSPASGAAATRSIVLYGIENGSMEALHFHGKTLKDGRLEGRSNAGLIANAGTPQMRWAIASFAADESLVELSEADMLTDQAIEWWLGRNPDVFTSASRVTYGSVPAESSLVSTFKAKKKEDGNGYRAAMFDYRGYTVIVVQRKSNGEYFLAWAEPVCVNKNRDRLLNSIYFENGANLVLFYYHGKRTYKYRLNLSNTRLTR